MEARKWHFSLWYLFIAMAVLLTVQELFTARHVETLSYNEFKVLLAAGKLDDVVVAEKEITGDLASDGLDRLLPKDRIAQIARLAKGEHHFVTLRVDDPDLIQALESANVRFSGRVESGLMRGLVYWILPAILLVVLWRALLSRQGGMAQGVLEIGKSKAKVFMEKEVNVTFADVAGADEAKEELREIVAFLKDPASHGRLGARIPKGILLVGPPGTGKTLLARAVAGEASVPFFSINGSEFVEMFVGVGAARVRDLFDKARARAPAIIFIDELDALGRARGSFALGSHDEKEQTLNQLLSELDGFDQTSGLVLLAATNRPEILDPALLRAGRFDRQVLVDRPDRPGRRQILALYLRKVHCEPGIDAEEIAALTPGFTGADLANLVNEAALGATRREATAVGMTDFRDAIERIVAGLEKKSRILSPAERRIVATHELGHAIVAMTLPGSEPVQKVSIIPRGIAALGYTLQRPTEDRFLVSRKELEAKMTVMLGGRAAERVVFDDVSSGAADDLEKASSIARNMVTRFGMDATIGNVSYAEPGTLLGIPQLPAPSLYSPQTGREIDQAVRTLVDAAYERALAVVKAHRPELDRWAALLLERETLEGDGLAELRAAVAAPLAGSAPDALNRDTASHAA